MLVTKATAKMDKYLVCLFTPLSPKWKIWEWTFFYVLNDYQTECCFHRITHSTHAKHREKLYTYKSITGINIKLARIFLTYSFSVVSFDPIPSLSKFLPTDQQSIVCRPAFLLTLTQKPRKPKLLFDKRRVNFVVSWRLRHTQGGLEGLPIMHCE